MDKHLDMTGPELFNHLDNTTGTEGDHVWGDPEDALFGKLLLNGKDINEAMRVIHYSQHPAIKDPKLAQSYPKCDNCGKFGINYLNGGYVCRYCGAQPTFNQVMAKLEKFPADASTEGTMIGWGLTNDNANSGKVDGSRWRPRNKKGGIEELDDWEPDEFTDEHRKQLDEHLRSQHYINTGDKDKPGLELINTGDDARRDHLAAHLLVEPGHEHKNEVDTESIIVGDPDLSATYDEIRQGWERGHVPDEVTEMNLNHLHGLAKSQVIPDRVAWAHLVSGHGQPLQYIPKNGHGHDDADYDEMHGDFDKFRKHLVDEHGMGDNIDSYLTKAGFNDAFAQHITNNHNPHNVHNDLHELAPQLPWEKHSHPAGDKTMPYGYDGNITVPHDETDEYGFPKLAVYYDKLKDEVFQKIRSNVGHTNAYLHLVMDHNMGINDIPDSFDESTDPHSEHEARHGKGSDHVHGFVDNFGFPTVGHIDNRPQEM